MFEPGDKVEYAVHPVVWQAGHNETDKLWHQADGREPVPAAAEDWRPATVVSVTQHPVMPHLNKFEPDIIVKLAPSDGAPPFDLNAKLVRSSRQP